MTVKKSKIFDESDLKIEFGTNWTVKKYDDQTYFTLLSGRGLKGVDFIGIYGKDSLYLIEVKNYHKRSYSPVAPDWADLQGSPPPLVEIMYKKIEDSLRLIRIVATYHSRQWWFRFAKYFRNLFDLKGLEKDWQFWDKVAEIALQKDKVFPVLWLELSPEFLRDTELKKQDLKTRITTEVSKLLKNSSHNLKIVSINNWGEIALHDVKVKMMDEKNLL